MNPAIAWCTSHRARGREWWSRRRVRPVRSPTPKGSVAHPGRFRPDSRAMSTARTDPLFVLTGAVLHSDGPTTPAGVRAIRQISSRTSTSSPTSGTIRFSSGARPYDGTTRPRAGGSRGSLVASHLSEFLLLARQRRRADGVVVELGRIATRERATLRGRRDVQLVTAGTSRPRRSGSRARGTASARTPPAPSASAPVTRAVTPHRRRFARSGTRAGR